MDKWEVGVRGVAWIYVRAPSAPEAIRQAVQSWNKKRHDTITSSDITSIANVTHLKKNPSSDISLAIRLLLETDLIFQRRKLNREKLKSIIDLLEAIKYNYDQNPEPKFLVKALTMAKSSIGKLYKETPGDMEKLREAGTLVEIELDIWKAVVKG